MAKKDTSKKEEVESNTETIKYNSKAFSILYLGNKKYRVVGIDFCSKTGHSSKTFIVSDNLDIYESHHEFKKATIDAGLFEIGVDKGE